MPDARQGALIRRSVLAAAVLVLGFINLASAFLSHPSERLLALRRLVPTEVLDTSRTFTLLAGVLLVITAWGLRHGKRRAFVAALFLCALSVPLNLLKAADVEEACAAAALLFFLGLSGDAFHVKSRALTWRGLQLRFSLAAIGLGLYAFLGCLILEARYGPGPSPARAASEAAFRLFGVGEPSLSIDAALPPRERRIVEWYLGSLLLLGVAVVGGLGIAALRPAAHGIRRHHDRDEAARIWRLHGVSPVAYFALDPDTDYFFSATRRAVVAYRFEMSTLLAIGDPIGPQEEHEPLLRAFAGFCDEHDWRFGFFQATADAISRYRDLGWRALHIGEEPILSPASFSLEGGAIGDVRRAVRKLEAAGLGARSFFPGEGPGIRTDATLLRELHGVSEEWLRGRRGGEKGFCMSRFDADRLGDVWVVAAWNPNAARVEAFLTWTPVPARGAFALDLMRRRPTAPAGVMDFLVAKSIEEARSRSIPFLSLSLSPLAQVGEEAGETAAVRRARAFLAAHLARFYDFESLFRWKKKFQPAFEDRYLVYSDPLALPRVALALVRAQSPGGLRAYFGRAGIPRNLASTRG